MYKNGFQGAWQKGRTTTINASTLIEIYEEASIYKKELHVTYIDLTKAYDSVEHWSIKQTLAYYNFDEHIIKIIMSLIEDTYLSVITNHGTCEKFKVGRGVRYLSYNISYMDKSHIKALRKRRYRIQNEQH
jgi:Reverse transcriptase (RNA-dependent DNA polymerase)